jgi:diguanylate cyclase (GGDEF)-like protein
MSAYELIGYSLVVLAIFQATLSVICFSKGYSNRAAFLTGWIVVSTSLYSLSAGITYLQAGKGLDYSFFYRNCWLGWISVPAVLHLVVHMVETGPLVRRVLLPISYAFWVLVWFLAITTQWVDIAPVSLIPYQEVEAPYEVVLRSLAMLQLLALIVILIRAYRRVHGTRRIRVQYLLFGFITNSVAAILTSSILYLVFNRGLDPALTSLFGITLSGPLFYSMTRHRLFDIRIVLSRMTMTVALTAVLAALHYTLVSFFGPILGLSGALILSSIFVGLVLFLSPVLDWAKSLSIRLFHRNEGSATLLRDLSNILISSSNTDDLFRKFGDHLRGGVGVQSICFYTTEENEYKLKHFSGPPPKYFDRDLSLSNNTTLSKILLGDRQIFVKEEHVETDLYGVNIDSQGILAELDDFANDELLVPLAARGSVVGIMALGPKINDSGFTREDLSVVEAAGSQLGLAIENTRLFEEAVGDGLTGLYHQKYFKIRLHSEVLRSRRHGNSIAVLLMDVDHFKAINDNFGHLVGDHVLQGIAGVLRSSFRGEDVIARYGGEEFAILLVETDPKSVPVVAERVRKRISEHDFHHALRVTMSIGVYVFDPKLPQLARQLSAEDLLARADRALYDAKGAGRDRVHIFKEGETALLRT